MTSIKNENSEHFDDLLPWFVNGTLSQEEQEHVAAHIERCARCQKEVRFLKKMHGEIRLETVQSPGELGLKKLLREIRQERKVISPESKVFVNWWRSPLALAASFIIILQAGLLIQTWTSENSFTPLSGPKDSGVVLQITFSPTATEEKIRESLRAVEGTIIDGPSALELYKVRLNLLPDDSNEIERRIKILEGYPEIITHVARE